LKFDGSIISLTLKAEGLLGDKEIEGTGLKALKILQDILQRWSGVKQSFLMFLKRFMITGIVEKYSTEVGMGREVESLAI
jgi:hypothetical protein